MSSPLSSGIVSCPCAAPTACRHSDFRRPAAKVFACGYPPAKRQIEWFGSALKAEPLHKFAGDGRNVLAHALRQRLPRICALVTDHDPQSRTVDFVVARTDRPGQLRELQIVGSFVGQVQLAILGGLD